MDSAIIPHHKVAIDASKSRLQQEEGAFDYGCLCALLGDGKFKAQGVSLRFGPAIVAFSVNASRSRTI